MKHSLKTIIRRKAGLSKLDRCSVVIVPGDAAPTQTGESWHYKTKGGQRIWHPASYSKSGWSNMVYCPSDRRVEVGADYLLDLSFSSK